MLFVLEFDFSRTNVLSSIDSECDTWLSILVLSHAGT